MLAPPNDIKVIALFMQFRLGARRLELDFTKISWFYPYVSSVAKNK
jgi:hypothetical protein